MSDPAAAPPAGTDARADELPGAWGDGELGVGVDDAGGVWAAACELGLLPLDLLPLVLTSPLALELAASG